MRLTIRSLLGRLWLAVAGAIVLFAVVSSGVRLLLPQAEHYHAAIERWLGAALGQPVSIGRIAADWHRLGPRLVLSDVVLGREASTLRFARAEVAVNLPLSLLHGSLRIDSFIGSGLRLLASREPDGTIRIAGTAVAGTAAGDGDGGLAAWLLEQGRLSVRDGEVAWRDSPAGEVVFRDLSFDVRSRGGRHRLHGSVALPDSLGERLVFAADLQGGPGDPGWRLRTYIEGIALRPAGWQPAAAGVPCIAQGSVGLRLWSDWGPDGLDLAAGEVQASGLRLVPAPGIEGAAAPVELGALSGRFTWRRQAAGWRLDAEESDGAAVAREAASSVHPPRRFAVLSEGSGPGRSLRIHVDRLDLSEAVRLALLGGFAPAPLRAAAAGLDPHGSVTDLDVRIGEEGRRYAAEAGIAGLQLSPWGRYPGIAGIAGRLTLDEGGGAFELAPGGPTEVAFGDLFRGPLPISSLAGRIEWSRLDDGWRVSLPGLELRNEDLAVQAWGRLDLTDDRPDPFVALFARFESPSVRHLPRYLPVGIMHAGAISWLDRAIVEGSVSDGELTLAGRLGDFPFDNRDGVFRVEFGVHGGVLDYTPGWPAIADIDAALSFEGRGLLIRGTHGTSLSSTIGRAEVRIDDLSAKPPVLSVAGEAQGETADVPRFLSETPLAASFGGYARDLTASGRSRLGLRLSLPLGEGAPEVDGTLGFDDSALTLAHGAVDIGHIRGSLRFSGDGLEARRIRATLMGVPANLSVRSRRSPAGIVTQVEAGGSAGAKALSGLLRLDEPGILSGETAWKARLVIPPAARLEADGLQLSVESPLTGLGVALPPPLAKAADEPLPLEVEMRFASVPSRVVRLSLGERLAAAFAIDADAHVERGELHFGGGEATLPEEPGVRVTGTTDEVDADGWIRLLRRHDGGAGAVPLNAVAANVGQLDLFGRDFHQLRLSARREEEGWLVDLQGREIAGRITVPPGEDAEWRAQLDRLYLDKARDAGDDGPVDPRRLPALRLESTQFHYADTDFGHLTLRASRRPDGMALDELTLASPRMRIEARGAWSVADERQSSTFDIHFSSPDFGRALTALGYAGAIDGGRASAAVKASWPGGPTAFALERMDGTLDLEVADGQLLDVEPGAGRIFGLISLQALPRRLLLDFSDFFGKGFGFDRIAGHFDIGGGVAHTRGLTMTGPAARMTASGDIKLAERQYDQTVVVTPNVTSGLPVAGAVAGGLTAGAVTGGLGLGAAIFLMERALRSDIDRMTQITYRVLGPWNDPLIVRLQEGGESGTK